MLVEKKAPEVAKEEKEVDPSLLAKESLSVSTTELGNREDPLYKPVSSTPGGPLPDSPCDEAKPAQEQEQNKAAVTKPTPFKEVINKKAVEEDVKSRKHSAAVKKAQLDSKGVKGRDLLDMLTVESAGTKGEEGVVKKSPEVVKEKKVEVKKVEAAPAKKVEAAPSKKVKAALAKEPKAVKEVVPTPAPNQNSIPSHLYTSVHLYTSSHVLSWYISSTFF